MKWRRLQDMKDKELHPQEQRCFENVKKVRLFRLKSNLVKVTKSPKYPETPRTFYFTKQSFPAKKNPWVEHIRLKG